MTLSKPMHIYLADLVHDYVPGNYVVPLNIGLVGSYLKHNFGTEVDVRLFKSPGTLIEALRKEAAPHILAFSNYSWNQELNASVARKARKLFPDVIIVGGGPHIRTTPQGIAEHLQRHREVDYYCMFEGEYPMGRLVQHFLEKGGLLRGNDCDKTLVSVAYLNQDRLIYSPPETQKRDILDIPSPYLNGMLDDYLSSPQWVPLFETNRGCPFHCTFCVWGIAAMDKVRV